MTDGLRDNANAVVAWAESPAPRLIGRKTAPKLGRLNRGTDNQVQTRARPRQSGACLAKRPFGHTNKSFCSRPARRGSERSVQRPVPADLFARQAPPPHPDHALKATS